MATDLDTSTPEPPAHPRGWEPATPGWLVEVVEVLELRRSVLVATALGLSLLGVLTAMVVPQLLPPRPLVGAAVGLAAVLLAVAAALGVDSVDLTIRGPRHIRASGGRLAAELAGTPDPRTLASLAAAVSRRAGAGSGRIGITPASEAGADPQAWTEALARALSARDLRVLLVDLVADRTGRPGVGEVAAGEARLAEAVEFDHELMLATLGAGRDRRDALGGLPSLVDRLPSDIEVLLVALPHLSETGALAAAGALDRVLVLVEEDRTPRVDLIASLDAVDATPAASEVVLLRDEAPSAPAPAAGVSEEVSIDVAREVAGTTDTHDDEPPTAPAPRPPLARMTPAQESPLDPTDEPSGPATAEPDEHVVDLTDEASPIGEPSLDEAEGRSAVAAAATVSGMLVGREPTHEAVSAPATPRATDADVWTPTAPEPVAEDADTDEVGAPHQEPVADEPDEPVAAAEPVDAPQVALDPDPTLETPPVVVHDELIPADTDEEPEPGRWATPANHDEVVGSHLAAGPFPDQQDLPEDPVRVAAALQTLAAEVWGRDDERS